jgi:type IV pilus assembly protein PilY1
MDRRQFGLLAAIAVCAALAAPARAQDDTDLFNPPVPPNVLLLMDNSGSMNHIVWHPDFDPNAPTSCNYWTSDQQWSSTRTESHCGTTRTYYVDPEVPLAGNNMRFDRRYLNWLHSLPNGDPRLTEYAATANGTYSACLQAQGYTTYSKYRRARVTAAKDVLREVICNVNQAGKVRFGIAQFRLPGGDNDANGGFVRVPINDYDAPNYTLNGFTQSHGAHLDTGIDSLEGVTWTPLGESLFQLYTYFMSRTAADRPTGVGGGTFPGYAYRTTLAGNFGPASSTQIPISPVQYACQKNFVIVITDGEPTKDDFDNSNSGDNTSQGFGSFGSLIGNYLVETPPAPVETEINGWACGGVAASEECALYLDDIAAFMHGRDFRPDMDGDQTLDVYTVGFSTTAYANDLLSRTAAAGGGRFYASNNAEELAEAITDAVTDIIGKSQSFTAATVPATRTADGGNIYTSLFTPSQEAYWKGELKLFQITSAGDILDEQGQCALLNPMPVGECKSGPVDPNADPWWDAGEEIPDPESRNLYTSLLNARVDFRTSLPLGALGDPFNLLDDLTLADLVLYVGSGATTLLGLKDAIVQNVRGCEMGTGLLPGTCVRRDWLLGDIFHSNPLVVGRPRGFINELSYRNFAATYSQRTNVVYAGANDGFLHAFHAGDWQTAATPPGYDRGTGRELFGFMPWPARQNAKYLPIDTGSRDYYYVDGSPAAADVWMYPTSTTVTKNPDGSEWRTIVTGGLRQGGHAYYALDVTDPGAGSYPGYLWEFPAENAPAATRAAIGETWGQPVVTKVQVDIGGQPYERWVAIVSGGYDRSSDPNDALNYDPASTAGRGIYLIDVKTGQVLGEKKFVPTETDGREDMLYAMPSTPSVFDTDLDGFADVIYIGDLGGNVWKWVIKWDPVRGNHLGDAVNHGADVSQPNTKFRRWFAAQADATSSLGVTLNGVTYYKSIFYSPSGATALNRFWLAFGTGERAALTRTHDASSDAENNRFYAVKDEDPLDRRLTPIPMLTEADLADQSSDATCPNLAAVSGFFFRVEDDEKFVTDSEIFSYWVITSSFIPAGTADLCNAGGDGSLYIFKLFCGQGFFYNSATYSEGAGSLPGGGPGGTGGKPTSTVNYGDPESRRIRLGPGMPTDPRVTVSPDGTRVVVTQQDGEIENEEGPPGGGAAPGQLYWREVTWRDADE